ncbi:MAG: response regulator [Desulfobacteraceae bacterium]|nr:response regulator [Desulfobacteraceae bacterium]
MNDGPVEFIEDNASLNQVGSDKFWKVMIVDDEKSIHDITITSLKGFMFEGRGLRFLNAFSGQEAVALFHLHPDTALLIVDVVMETQNAGLNFVHYVREKLKNHVVQVVIRTGQPGLAPESDVISKYKINAYYSKTELRIQKLISLFTTSLRTFDISVRLEAELEKRREAEQELISLNKSLEEKIEERTRQLVRANQLKSLFLANVSHEIRTPMNGIVGMADLLMDEDLAPDQKEYARIIQSSAASLLAIINDILDISKIESGQVIFEQRSFSVKMLVHEVISLFRIKAGEKNLDLIINVSEDMPHFLVGDETRIKQILINLVGNAVKFTEQGFIRLAARIENKDRDECLLFFEVEDTGPGIDDAYTDRMFDPFSQQDASITRKFGGTGLGLAISRHLARLMSGDVTVYNEKPYGSVFKVVLQLKKNVSGSLEAVTGEGEKEKISDLIERISQLDLKILLAEDHPVNQRVILLMLKKMNLSATVVANGEEVLKMIREKAFDLILMDVRMPVLDGIETTKIIRAPESDIKTKNIPIIALTALAMQEDAERCLKAGMDRYLTKPIHSDKIAYAIADLFKV